MFDAQTPSLCFLFINKKSMYKYVKANILFFPLQSTNYRHLVVVVRLK